MHSGAPPGSQRVLGTAISDKALRRLMKHMRRQITDQQTPEMPRCGSAGSATQRRRHYQRESECDALVEELLRGGYLENLPQPDP